MQIKSGCMPCQVPQPPIGGPDLCRPTLVQCTWECQEIVDGLMPCLKQLDLGLCLPKLASHPICPELDTHISTLACNCNTLHSFHWRIRQYFFSAASAGRSYILRAQRSIEDDMCAKPGNINSGCNDVVFLETTTI